MLFRSPDGPRFTRDGGFVVGGDGVLRTRQGLAVRGVGPLDRPAPQIVVPAGTADLSVGSDGSLSTGDRVLGRVALVRFPNMSQLHAEGGSLIVAEHPGQAVQSPDATVVSGFLEGANVGPIAGMNELITASRSFEAFQRVIQTFRSLDERTARDLAGHGCTADSHVLSRGGS